MKRQSFKIILAMISVISVLSSCDRYKMFIDSYEDFHADFKVSSVFPSDGEPGTIVHIKGKGFAKDSSKVSVKVNNISAQILSITDTAIQARLPETNSAMGNISVTVGNVPFPRWFPFHFFDLYVTGEVYNSSGKSFARLWKNSVAQAYPDSSFNTATRLFKDGTDIYFGTNSGYFKNNTYVKLNSNSTNMGVVNSVIVNDGNVIAGGPGGYYKNGTFVQLNQRDPYPYLKVEDIIAVNDTLYLAGSDFYDGGILCLLFARKLKLNSLNQTTP